MFDGKQFGAEIVTAFKTHLESVVEPLKKEIEELRRELASVKTIADAFYELPSPTNGKDGKDGENGKDGANGLDGKDGIPGRDGRDGFPGVPGLDGKDGAPGLNGKDGAPGLNGKDGAPGMMYRGVYKSEAGNELGDTVTYDGSVWVALENTIDKPGNGSKTWQLAVKRGRDGKDGEPGKPGPQGIAGKDGRDLTQIGPDGSKW